jgi:hypothetical protein
MIKNIIFISLSVISISCLRESKADQNKILIVNTESLILREQPSIRSKKIASLFNGRALKVVDSDERIIKINHIASNWFRVSTFDNKTGYVFGGYLKEPESCETAGKLSLNDPLRNNLCRDISNYYECSALVEQKEIKKYKFVTRKNKELIIRLSNGNELKYTDVIPQKKEDGIKITHYTFREYIRTINSFIITSHYYEGGTDTLVNHNSGESIRIWNTPVIISPDAGHILIISGVSTYKTCGIQILKNGSLSAESIFETSEYNPVNAKWIDNRNIEILCMNSLDPDGIFISKDCYIFTIHLKEINHSWIIEK